MQRLVTALLCGVIGLFAGVGIALGLRTALAPTAMVIFVALLGLFISGVVRRLPHRHEFALETVWRGMLGVGVGTGLALLAIEALGTRSLPFAIPPLPRETRLLEHPIVVGLLAGGALGLLFGVREEAPARASSKPGETPSAAGR